MTSRRNLLLSFGSGAVAGGTGVYLGLSARSSGYGTLEWINERDEEVWVTTTVGHGQGPPTEEDVEYQSRYRIFPTDHYRGGDTNVVKTDTYTVEVEVESKDRTERAGPFTTIWAPAGCHHQTLIVRVTHDMSVTFEQKEC